MTISTLKERISSYEEVNNFKLMKKLPVIIVINGRSFKKTTSLITKPYSSEFMEAMCGVMIKLAAEIDGSTFLYCFNDEIVIVARNDQSIETEPWYDNNIQKIVSASASIASLALKTDKLNILGDAIFTSKVFTVPNITEAINVLISKQQQAHQTSVFMACFYELLKKYDPNSVMKTLYGLNMDEKIDLLREECGIDFNKYPLPFRRGVACYRAPKVVATEHGDEIKNKLTIDMELPIFTKDHNFLSNIFRSGRDIVRAQRNA